MPARVTSSRRCAYVGDTTWEDAVRWLRTQPDQTALVRDCYYDDPLLVAAERFACSEEWQAVRALLPPRRGRALDIGAGRGIGSYALARDGWQVTALEPDPSSLVGAAAIRGLEQESRLPIDVVQETAEALPFAAASFDLVYGRAVLHHARDLGELCRQVGCVLKPGGRLIATREHVISRTADLPAFLAAHPLHRLYGGEHAYLLVQYRDALRGAGLKIETVIGPFDSPINFAPLSAEQRRASCAKPLALVLGTAVAHGLVNERHAAGRWLLARLAAVRSWWDDTPGRLYSFVAQRPPAAEC